MELWSVGGVEIAKGFNLPALHYSNTPNLTMEFAGQHSRFLHRYAPTPSRSGSIN